MSISWCPSQYINFLNSIGRVEILEESIKFCYNNINFNFRAKDEIEIFNEVFLNKEYEIPMNNESVVIDIGANVGIASIYFASNDYISKVYSFEPFRLTYNCFIDNVDLNPALSMKIQPNNYGMGRADKLGKGIINDILKGNSRISDDIDTPSTYTGHPGEYIVEEVAMKRASTIIKNIIEENEGLDVIIKMDCEGGETEIFEDDEFVDLLDNVKAIVMETHTPEIFTEICDVLRGKDFKLNGGMVSASNGYIKAMKNI
ncbi:FkbM family methyltransferase [Romboutsia sp.]|uniref:FkbM family methyltransferase n=1 Tax=Romboutsia sp. TaxID=1965302 RepID=UPI003F3E6E9D